MLYKYKNNYQKIAMGLLSLIPDMKEVARLQEEIKWYQAEDNRTLFLWKNEDNDFTGVLGVEVNDGVVMVRQIAISPAERNEGVTYKMLDNLEKLFPEQKIMGSMDTSALVVKWEKKKNENQK